MNAWSAVSIPKSLPLIRKLAIALIFVSASASAKDFAWLENSAHPLCKTESVRLIAEAASGRRLVLLGESTHGTHEYYVWRDQISRALIASGNAHFIAVEGDWAPLWALNLYVKGKPGAAESAYDILKNLKRWPTWMWANNETVDLIEWLREWNAKLAPEKRIGFYGMDVYAPWDAADNLIGFFAEHQPSKVAEIKMLLHPFTRHRESPECLIRAESWHPSALLRSLAGMENQLNRLEDVPEIPCHELFSALQSLRVIRGAHRHFMAMATEDSSSWNARVEHMKATVGHLLNQYGEESQGIVWAHNTHIGDARATSMRLRGDFNIGQLARIRWGRDGVYAVGFTTHRGTVQAGHAWEANRTVMNIPPALQGSLECVLNQYFPDGAVIKFAGAPDKSKRQQVQHRAIGVVYQPEFEAGNYVPTLLPLRYDALVFLPETNALSPLHF